VILFFTHSLLYCNEQPTSPPTSPPTNNPTIPGMGYCSDKPAVPCLTVDDCTCANNFSAALYERTRHLLVCASITKANVCNNSAGCQWFGGSSGCGVAPTSPPTNLPTPQPTNEATPPPTSNPTPLPTNAPSIPPTKVPTSPPTPSVSVIIAFGVLFICVRLVH